MKPVSFKQFLLLLTIGLMAVVSLFQSYFNFALDRDLEIYFLDIGQGDSILIKTPHGKLIVIDSGYGSTVVEELGEVLPYFSKTIDIGIFSHADGDHIDGYSNLLRRFKFKNIFATRSDKSTFSYQRNLNLIEGKSIPNFEIKSLNDFTIDNVTFEVIWPLDPSSYSDFDNINNYSIGLYIHYKDFDFITMGDLESEFELKAVKSIKNLDKKSIELLKASHHGSPTSSSKEVIQTIKPDTPVISVGVDNSYGHPSEQVLENLEYANSHIYRTDLNGRVEISTDGQNYSVKTQR